MLTCAFLLNTRSNPDLKSSKESSKESSATLPLALQSNGLDRVLKLLPEFFLGACREKRWKEYHTLKLVRNQLFVPIRTTPPTMPVLEHCNHALCVF